MNAKHALCACMVVLALAFGVEGRLLAASEERTLTPEEATALIKRADDLLRGKSSHSTMTMTIVTPRWSRTLTMESWSLGTTRSLIRIHAPPKEAGTGSLKIDREMWNYLPKVDRVIRIPPSMMLQSWMGSDFTNDDLVRESSIVEDYTHRHVATHVKDGVEIATVELIPKPDAPVVWGKIIFFVRTADAIPVREEFWSERGELIKVMELSAIKKMDDRHMPTKWVMTPLNKNGHSTTIVVDDMQFNLKLDDSMFSLQQLRRYTR